MPRSETTIEVARGRDDSFVVSLFDEANAPAVFDPSDALDASVWIGGSEAELYSPGAAWLSAPDGTITLTTTAAGTAALAPGTYPLEVFVTPAATSLKISVASFWLAVVDAPGASETSLPVYGTFQDLRDNGGGYWLDMLRRDGLANCLRERAKARQWLDDAIVNAIRPLDPRGPYRYAIASGATHPDEPCQTIRDALDADGLVVDARIVELSSLKALEYVCRSRLTFESGDLWASRSRFFAAEANRLALSTRAVIANDDGATIFAVHLGTASIR